MTRIELEDRTFWFVNLTNGLDAVWQMGLDRFEFVRIKSSDVEYGKWTEIIDRLDIEPGERLLVTLARFKKWAREQGGALRPR